MLDFTDRDICLPLVSRAIYLLLNRLELVSIDRREFVLLSLTAVYFYPNVGSSLNRLSMVTAILTRSTTRFGLCLKSQKMTKTSSN